MVRVIVGRNAERLENCLELGKLSGRRCISTPVDARKPTRLEEAVEKTVASFGRIDFVICGASNSAFLGKVLSYQFEFDPRGHWQLHRSHFWTLGECV